LSEELVDDDSEECTNPLIKAPKEKRAERVSQELLVS
jgi:putative ubiquitin-RnfH superfamily antitoxin RatB of RatAB toxin-antitoxin module